MISSPTVEDGGGREPGGRRVDMGGVYMVEPEKPCGVMFEAAGTEPLGKKGQ